MSNSVRDVLRPNSSEEHVLRSGIQVEPRRLGCYHQNNFMPEPFKLTRLPSLKTVGDFRNHCAALGIELPCEDAIESGASSPLMQAIGGVAVNGKRIGNRIAIHPMEGWDGTTSGGVSEEMRRRWQRFGES